jgi:hypothetical protein
MKAVAPLFFGFLLMAGCSVGKPPIDEVQAIEGVTAHSACVGSLDRWHRIFAFQKRGNRINRDAISVKYIQAGHLGLAAGRVIAEPDRRTIIDDSQHRVAGGEYDRSSRRFSEWTCGCSLPPYNVDHPTDCPANVS